MKPLPPQWLKLVEPYRKREWLGCLEILRPLVDRYPDDLGTRLLFASLCLVTDQEARALVQLEKLLPLAVGQGDLYRALAAQKQLDHLRGEGGMHDKRFVAIHQWFGAIPARRVNRKDHAGIAPSTLLALSPEAFHGVAEESVIEDLGLEPRELAGDAGTARVVLYGRVRWSVAPEGGRSTTEAVADELDTIALAPDLAGARLALAPELPTACLRFDRALIESERATSAARDSAGSRAGEGRSGPAGQSIESEHGPKTWADVASWGVSSVESGAAADSPADAASGAEAQTADPTRTTARPRVARPVPDPRLEPTVAVDAPFDRRRETRVSVAFESRAAMIGLAGSRVAPFAGRLFDLSPSGLGLGFPRAELLPARELLEGALVTVEIQLPDGEPPLRMTSRVRWVRLAPQRDGTSGDMGVMGLEFVLVNAREHARIQNALIAAARAGQSLDPTEGGPEGTTEAA